MLVIHLGNGRLSIGAFWHTGTYTLSFPGDVKLSSIHFHPPAQRKAITKQNQFLHSLWILYTVLISVCVHL